MNKLWDKAALLALDGFIRGCLQGVETKHAVEAAEWAATCATTLCDAKKKAAAERRPRCGKCAWFEKDYSGAYLRGAYLCHVDGEYGQKPRIIALDWVCDRYREKGGKP